MSPNLLKHRIFIRIAHILVGVAEIQNVSAPSQDFDPPPPPKSALLDPAGNPAARDRPQERMENGATNESKEARAADAAVRGRGGMFQRGTERNARDLLPYSRARRGNLRPTPGLTPNQHSEIEVFEAYNFKDVLMTSARAAWQIEDVLPNGSKLDFSLDFLPQSLARTADAPGLDDEQRRALNHIRGHEYLSIFGLVEEFILPFVLDHARPQLDGDDERVRALLNFASEEAKHIHLFKLFHQLFTDAFGTECAVIGPPETIAAKVLGHDPLAVALLILHIEWMTQRHYAESIHHKGDLDPLFKSLLKHHWMEEAQHAKLDTLMVAALVEGRDETGIQKAIDEYLELGMFLDNGFRAQAEMNAVALEKAHGIWLPADTRASLIEQQHQALRWTYIGSGMTHPKFVATLAAMSPAARDRIAEVAPAFC